MHTLSLNVYELAEDRGLIVFKKGVKYPIRFSRINFEFSAIGFRRTCTRLVALSGWTALSGARSGLCSTTTTAF